ncbi:MAG: HD domain-containing protein [Bdellovibrionales bacterium]
MTAAPATKIHPLDAYAADPNSMSAQEQLFWVTEAVQFSAKAHRDQRRKEVDFPYFNHKAETARIVRLEPKADLITIIAAYLHDVKEDTHYGRIIRQKFGNLVADVVNEVSHQDDTLSSEAKKEHQIKKFPTMSWRAQLVKMADKYSNSKPEELPKKWTPEKKRFNLNAAAAIFELGKELSPTLYDLFQVRYAKAMQAIDREEQSLLNPPPRSRSRRSTGPQDRLG